MYSSYNISQNFNYYICHIFIHENLYMKNENRNFDLNFFSKFTNLCYLVTKKVNIEVPLYGYDWKCHR